VAAERARKGREAEFTAGTPDPEVARRGAPAYFRTYEQVKQGLIDLQTKYPQLVEVRDIGDSSEKVAGKANRDVWLLRLTNKDASGPKPSAMHIAGEHAREIANPELVLRYATQLLEGFGRDPEATALLNSRIIDIVPMMNPDGHAVVEQGYASSNSSKLWQRKNTAPPSGVDLNRNYEFRWGGPGAGSNPSSDTYRGPSAASEPEVQAVQRHVAESKPGIFIDWHSHSKLNLYPWGDTREPAPDKAGLDAVARKFSTFNQYTPMQSIGLYPTSGTSKDYVYGTHRIPAFTVETGESFHQTDQEFDTVWADNAPVIGYANKIADAPFERVKGPDVIDLNVTAAGVARGVAPGTGLLSAQLQAPAGSALRGAELLRDPNARPGTGVPLVPADGMFDSASELARASLPQPDAATHELIYVRAQDAQGNWGPTTAQWLKGTPA